MCTALRRPRLASSWRADGRTASEQALELPGTQGTQGVKRSRGQQSHARPKRQQPDRPPAAPRCQAPPPTACRPSACVAASQYYWHGRCLAGVLYLDQPAGSCSRQSHQSSTDQAPAAGGRLNESATIWEWVATRVGWRREHCAVDGSGNKGGLRGRLTEFWLRPELCARSIAKIRCTPDRHATRWDHACLVCPGADSHFGSAICCACNPYAPHNQDPALFPVAPSPSSSLV